MNRIPLKRFLGKFINTLEVLLTESFSKGKSKKEMEQFNNELQVNRGESLCFSLIGSFFASVYKNEDVNQTTL